MKYYNVKMTGGDKFIISSEEVSKVIKAKGDGVEFIRIRNLFFNPKYIVSIAPNDDLNEAHPNGDYYLGREDEVLIKTLTAPEEYETKQLS